MAQEGETKTAHCKKCERETTWVYCFYMYGKEVWECEECHTRYHG